MAAISSAGVKGPFSDPRRFRVTSQQIRDRSDTEPPKLEISEFVPVGQMVIINGQTEPGATLWIDNRPLEIPLLMRSIWGIYSTAEDTLRFLRALIRGDVFEDPSTFGSMQQRWNRFGLPLDRAALRLPSWPIEYGLGIMRFHDPFLKLLARLPRGIVPIRPVPAVIGHTGSTGSWLFYCPKLDLLFTGTVDEARSGLVPYRLVPKILSVVERSAAIHS